MRMTALSYEQMEFVFVEAACLAQRRKELAALLTQYANYNGHPLVSNIADAFAVAELRREIISVDAEIDDCAAQSKQASFPELLWFQSSALDSKGKAIKIKLFHDAKGSPKLRVEA